MKWLAILGVLAMIYAYMLVHTMNTAMTQTQHLQATYQNIANQADQISNGH